MPISTEHRPHNLVDGLRRAWYHAEWVMAGRPHGPMTDRHWDLEASKGEGGTYEHQTQGDHRQCVSCHRDDCSDSDCLGTSNGTPVTR